ncbi:GGDEF domain-containing protein [Mycolicibacterium stellerae]|uniref:GGDEF domain-containing protein n=1 Tax=Mycolicibacterium stellerae TaxID=2358193 RepID=UPI0013DE4A11|nr:GGDEF domain-containing protein [Mycolicibacterium stellerae]
MVVLPDYSKSLGVFVRLVREWWSEPVDYAAQVQYFKRAMSGAVQILIGLGTGMDAVISAVVLLPSASTFASKVAVAVFVALQVFWAWVWCCRSWPSRSTSLAFVFSADLAIAVMVLLDGSWVLASFGFGFFAMLSVYLVFFDGPKVLAGHIGWVLVTTAAVAVKVGVDAQLDVVDFTAKTLLSAALVAGTPLGFQAAIWALRRDANESVTDPLTSLLNRRGLHMQVGDLVRDGYLNNAHVVVMVVDLDRFKGINDAFGHAVGDEVLVRSARRIKSAVRGSALVARLGGEEFVIVDLTEPGHTERVTERVLSAVAAPADRAPITASMGVTSVALAKLAPEIDPAALLDTLIGHADHAMFEAKRHGGNSAIHTQPVDSDG